MSTENALMLRVLLMFRPPDLPDQTLLRYTPALHVSLELSLMRLIAHVVMSPATTIKLALDPNRTVRGRRDLKQPSEMPSSPSESPTPTRGEFMLQPGSPPSAHDTEQ
jgi:hypothetical protein